MLLYSTTVIWCKHYVYLVFLQSFIDSSFFLASVSPLPLQAGPVHNQQYSQASYCAAHIE